MRGKTSPSQQRYTLEKFPNYSLDYANQPQHHSHSALFRHQQDLEGDADKTASDLGKLPLHPAEKRSSETEDSAKSI